MLAKSFPMLRFSWSLILVLATVYNAKAQIASYDFNSNAEDQVGGFDATIFGSPTFENNEYISFSPGQYLSLPLTMSQAIDVTDSWQVSVRFKVEGDWEATDGEEAQVVVSNKIYDQRFGGFDIAARQWEGRLQLITTFGDGITYEPGSCATCGSAGTMSEGKLDFVTNIDAGTWYEVKLKFVFSGDTPYIQYEVNGVVLISYFDDRVDAEGFRQTINKQQFWVGSDQDNDVYIYKTNFPKMDLQIDYLSFYSPIPAGSPGTVATVLQTLIDHMNGVGDALTDDEIVALRTEFVANWDNDFYEGNETVIWEYINTYAAKQDPVFSTYLNTESPNDFEPMETIQFLMEQWILDNRYGSETVSSMEGLVFEDHELFPGKVSPQAPRINDGLFTIDGDYQTNPGYYMNDQEFVIRPSGYYVAPGEIATITVPDALVSQGLTLYVGAHNANLAIDHNAFRRFPRIMTVYPINSKTITVANPFGGAIYVQVPDGSSFGPQQFEVDGAIKAPYYSTKTGFSNSKAEFEAALANQYVPWVDIESDNLMATISHGSAIAIEDVDEVLSLWNQFFDGVSIALGRPMERFRSEYFLTDRQNHRINTAIPASYPMPFEDYTDAYAANVTMPGEVERGTDWYKISTNEFFNIIMHEQGHLHNMPTMLHEQESNVNLLAAAAIGYAFGEPVDSAFTYSNYQRFNLETAAMNWMVTDNFYLGNRIGYDVSNGERTGNEQQYQKRGYGKYVDIAHMFGWDALGKVMEPWVQYQVDNPAWSPYSTTDDEYIETASTALGFNMAPHFEFWGIIPTDDMVDQLKDMPTSEVVKERLLQFRRDIPANNAEFQELYAYVSARMEAYQLTRYEELKTTYDESIAKRMTDRIDAILNKYYSITALDYNANPVITATKGTLYAQQNTALTLELDNFLVTDDDNEYPTDFTLSVGAGSNYTVSGTTITPATGFLGKLEVTVTVNDGQEDSEPFLATVTVVVENERPVITGMSAALSTDEDVTKTLQLNDLVVTDADHTYPDDFTLSVLGGDNYTVSGTTITPATDFFGELTVPVSVNDGIQESEVFMAQVTVNAVNDTPVILGAASFFVMNEDDTKVFRPDDVVVSDPDHAPGLYYVQLKAGENYTFTGSTLIPAANFNGQLTINMVALDGDNEEGPVKQLLVEVLAINDQPVIDGVVDDLTTKINESITISISDFEVTDPDNDFPGDFTMTLGTGDNYSLSGTTITPNADYTGELMVPVTVSDGELVSETYTATITVIPPNDTPVITGLSQALTTAEDTPILLSLSDFVVEDNDHTYPDDFTLKLYSGDNYSIAGDGTLRVIPDDNFFGELTVPVAVNDGLENSEKFNATITVTSVNDVPVIESLATTFSMVEDESLTIALSDLNVTDVDNTYPDDFTLNIADGSNYTVSGNTITPSGNFHGEINISLTVNDGTDDSEAFETSITVASVNDVPVISGLTAELSTLEDNSLTLSLSNFDVDDPDHTYPDDFTLTLGTGDNYRLTGNDGFTVTPDANFFGELTVPVTVNDGEDDSETFNATITVTSVNDVPVIESLATTFSMVEDQSLAIALSDLNVTDVDNTYPDDFTLKIADGSNYTISGNTITPSGNFNGVINISLTVNDGTDDSESFETSIDVASVNDVPIITGVTEEFSIMEDNSLTLSFSSFIVEDPDHTYPDDFTLTLGTGDNYSLTGNDGLTVTPDANFFGELTVPVTVNDGEDDSETYSAAIIVIGVNDAPVITGLATSFSMVEDEPLTIALSDLNVTDIDNDYPDDFTLKIADGANYTVSGNTITPSGNFNGEISLSLTVNDGTDDSEAFETSIDVASVNDVPVITGPTEALTTDEDTPITLSFSSFTVEDPDHTYPDDFTLTLGTGDNYSLTGDDGFTVKPDANFFGELTVPVTVNDGEDDSETFMATITVTSVNDVPVITSLATTFSMVEDEPLTVALSDLNVTDEDHDYPADFTLNLLEGANYTVSGNTVTPAEDYNGEIILSLTVNDGTDDSEVFETNIAVAAVNDPPVITGLAGTLTTQTDMPLTLALSDFIVDDPDNAYPGEFSFTVMEGENYTLSGSTITATDGFFGTLSVPVTVNDGQVDSEVFNATVNISPILGLENAWVKDRFKIYPNPARQYLNLIKDQDIASYDIRLLSLKGDVLLFESDINQTEYHIRLDALPEGLYILKVNSEKGSGNLKVIKLE